MGYKCQLDKEIEQYFLEYQLLRGRLMKLKSDERRAISGWTDNLNTAVIKAEIEDIEQTLEEMDNILDILDVKREDKAYSRILRKFYIEGKSIVSIAHDLICSEDNVYKLKAQAIDYIKVILIGKKACKCSFLKED